MAICLEHSADLHVVQLMPLPLTISCSSKIQTGFTFLVRLTRVVPDKGPLNGCVCVYDMVWQASLTCTWKLEKASLIYHTKAKTIVTLQPFNSLFSWTTCVSRYQKWKNQSAFKWGKRWWDFGMAVATAGPYANNLHLTPDINTSSLNVYRPDALPDAQPTVSKHWRQKQIINRKSSKKIAVPRK